MATDTQKRILLVDDNPIDLLVHRKMLEKAGLTAVHAVSSGQEALEYFDACAASGQYPHLLLLDVHMPVMGGLEFLARYCMRESWRRPAVLKIILLTSSIDPMDRLQAASCGVETFMDKPLNLEKLLTLLREEAGAVQPAPEWSRAF
jgi:CheY-like chemotaxis protein